MHHRCPIRVEAAESAPPAKPAGSRVPPPPPRSCDTFVALPPATVQGVVFGKNSDRPREEVQEVVAFPGGQHPAGTVLDCTYISVPQAYRTLAVVLSKPTWMWGAEMGANEAGVVCGNEAVWTVEESEGPPALLGMDLVRLALERGSTAAEAVDVIATLLEAHGQGGPCTEGGTWTYHNSFLVADACEAWVVETAGRCWAAQRITQGVRNISNVLSIRTDFDRCSAGLQQHAKDRGYWDGQGQFDFAAAFSEGGAPPLGQREPGREENGYRLLQEAAGRIDPAAMMGILRDEPSGICMCDGAFRSNGSQVSQLVMPAAGSSAGMAPPARHWFTATPDPLRSVFKPFAFPGAGDERAPPASPLTAAQPAARNPPHLLWVAWQQVHEGRKNRIADATELEQLKRQVQREEWKCGTLSVGRLHALEAEGLDPARGLTFAAAVEAEMKAYIAAVM